MTKISILAASAALALLACPASAQTPGEWRPYDLFARQGFDIDAVHAFAISRGGDAGEIKTTSNGERYGAYRSEYGVRYTVWPDFCSPAPCKGLVFAAYYPGSQFRLTLAELNEFNIDRAHGNASYSARGESYVLHRVVTNISGITNGSLAAEFGVFQGYSSKFDEFIREKTAASRNTAAADDASPRALAVSYVPDDEAAVEIPGLGEMSLTPEEVLQDLLEHAPADGIFYRGLGN